MSQFGSKHRVIKAIEKNDARLFLHLVQTQNIQPDAPLDKLGNNMFFTACGAGQVQMMQNISDWFQVDMHGYNSQGETCVHQAVWSCNFDAVKWLWEKGVDCHKRTLKYKNSPYQLAKRLLKDPRFVNKRRSLRQIKDFLFHAYFIDCRGEEVRKFLWIYSRLASKQCGFGKLTPYMARDISEFL